MNVYCLLVLLQVAPIVETTFGGDFRNFVHNRYGPEMVHMLERMDLGNGASVGGSEVGQPRYKGQPVIIVHGITNKIERFNVSFQHG